MKIKDITLKEMGEPLGKIGSVNGDKVTITKQDGTSMEVDKSALLPGGDNSVQINPDILNQLKPGMQVTAGDQQTTEDHPAIDDKSDDLINDVEYDLEEGNLDEVAANYTPEELVAILSGQKTQKQIDAEKASQQQTKEEIEDLGQGRQRKTNPDGTYEIGDGTGLKLYSATGQLIKIISPTFNGFSTETDAATGDVTSRSQQGHMDVQQTKDKTGRVVATKATADLGLGTLGYEKDRNNITTKSWAPRAAGEDPITQKDMYAMGDKSKEATYDRAIRQVQQTNESSELDAMLRIAGLR